MPTPEQWQLLAEALRAFDDTDDDDDTQEAREELVRVLAQATSPWRRMRATSRRRMRCETESRPSPAACSKSKTPLAPRNLFEASAELAHAALEIVRELGDGNPTAQRMLLYACAMVEIARYLPLPLTAEQFGGLYGATTPDATAERRW